MKLPTHPPFTLAQIFSSPGDWPQTVSKTPLDFLRKVTVHGIGATYQGRYWHWDELIRRPSTNEMSHEFLWAAMKFARQSLLHEMPLADVDGFHFRHTLVDPIAEFLRKVDREAGGAFRAEDLLPDERERDRFVLKSIVEESITSSQMEGASTTRKVASEMIRSGRRPRDRSERMIFNNYATMQHVRDLGDTELTPLLVLELHRRISEGTLDDASACGRLRRADEPVHVVEHYSGDVLYVPPPASELVSRLSAMCDFANGKTPDDYVHPVIRSIVLHFWLAYDHPFIDGNGRCARTLFYWSMLRHGYWMFEYISISRLILRARSQYAKAFLYTETDENDLTHFLLYHLKLLERAIDDVTDYLKGKVQEIAALSARLERMRELNHRQRALMAHALKKGDGPYTVKSHMTRQHITHQTARSDLYDLVDRSLLVLKKVGKTCYFYPADNLAERLK